MPGDLLVFPLPILTFLLAIVACVLAARLDLGHPSARNLFVAFFALIATGSLMVGLRFGYGIAQLIPLQRSLPLFAGPLLYLGFGVQSLPQHRRLPFILAHLGLALVVAVLAPLLAGDWTGMDWVIGLSYLIYAAGLLLMWRKGPDHLTYARLEMADGLRRWMLWAAGFLLALFVMDTAIAVSFAIQRSDSAMTLISLGSMILIPALIIIIVSVSNLPSVRQAKKATAPVLADEAASLEQSAHDLLINSQLYRDTDLSVERLAKRLHVPARALSAAINQSKGMNVSQYVNGFRLGHAASLLADTDLSVVKVMDQSGFLTRSNFYREFQRSYGQTPAAYRQNTSKGAKA
ncbi:MAG: helix-turn-helix transcriptional regulator [Albidovulum sp.]